MNTSDRQSISSFVVISLDSHIPQTIHQPSFDLVMLYFYAAIQTRQARPKAIKSSLSHICHSFLDPPANKWSHPHFSLQFLLRYIMRSGKLTGGLNIDDDQPVKWEKRDANEKKGNFQKDLDAMLFGGFGAPPPRRRQPAESKPAETAKPAETTKPAVQPTSPVQPQVTNPTVPATKPAETAKVQPSKPADVNKSTDSGKNVNTSQTTNIAISNTTGKVVVNPSRPNVLNKQKDPSILVPSTENEKAPTINTIPIESQPVLPPGKKVDNYVKPAEKVPQKKVEPVVVVPAQPAKSDEPFTIDVLHPFSIKNQFNKPGNLRKLKKVAEDFKFAEENVTLHSAVDVIRPYETDRTRQRKLNDFDFKDFEFPSSSVSLGGEHKSKPSVWKKQNQLAKTVSFGKYIDPNDVNPGILSNPHFVSTLSGIAELQANTKRLIEDQKSNSNGFYLIRLFINSVWRYIAVDSALPFIDGEHAGVVSNPDSEFELSSALIEKAYAKVFGGYDTFSRIQPRDHYLRDLTGAPVKKYSIDNPDLPNILKKAVAAGQLVLVVPNEKIASLGLNPNFSYPLINFTAKGSMELRNSFGTIEERSKISFRPEGTFDLGSAQARDFVSHVLVTSLNTSYSTSTIQSKHRQGFYSSYNFKVRNDTQGTLTVSQWDERLFPSNSGYEYSPFHIVLHRVEDDGNATFINAAFTPGSRNLDLEVSLTPGSYTVFASGNWRHTEYAYNLSFYGSERVDFERVYTSKVPNLISQSLEALNLQNGRRTDLNKSSSQYFLYHPESNLVVLTVENTSDRDSTVTADLSRVKFDHLVLLTSHNNEEDYSNKVGAEIEEYKQIPLTDRRWSVSLAGQHRFTWILAADQPYSESNPKSWGFN